MYLCGWLNTKRQMILSPVFFLFLHFFLLCRRTVENLLLFHLKWKSIDFLIEIKNITDGHKAGILETYALCRLCSDYWTGKTPSQVFILYHRKNKKPLRRHFSTLIDLMGRKPCKGVMECMKF